MVSSFKKCLNVQPVIEDRTEDQPIKTKQRTVALPRIGITPYVFGVKRTPTFDGDALNLTLMITGMKNNEHYVSTKLDPMYALLKIFSVNMEDPWPGWTGFNTLIRQSNIPNVSKLVTSQSWIPLLPSALHLMKS